MGHVAKGDTEGTRGWVTEGTRGGHTWRGCVSVVSSLGQPFTWGPTCLPPEANTPRSHHMSETAMSVGRQPREVSAPRLQSGEAPWPRRVGGERQCEVLRR